jgi:hypothetical protein
MLSLTTSAIADDGAASAINGTSDGAVGVVTGAPTNRSKRKSFF